MKPHTPVPTTKRQAHEIERWCGEDLHATANSHRWSIVLAGGEGERAQEYVRARFGRNRPKQYCNFIGTRSLLQHTVDRADRLSPASNRVIVVASHHRHEIGTQLEGRARGTVLFQPRNRGTAAGLFLALSHVVARDPDAAVVVYPSDHFVYPESAFLHAVSSAIALCRLLPERPLVLGVRPQDPESDYGWVQCGDILARGEGVAAQSVARLVEKPPSRVAAAMKRAGALWNTSILIARPRTLWHLGLLCLPEMTASFAAMATGLRRRATAPDAETIYRRMESHDLSRELLAPAVEHLAVAEINGFYWRDWGRPSRIVETLELLPCQRDSRYGTSGEKEGNDESLGGCP